MNDLKNLILDSLKTGYFLLLSKESNRLRLLRDSDNIVKDIDLSSTSVSALISDMVNEGTIEQVFDSPIESGYDLVPEPLSYSIGDVIGLKIGDVIVQGIISEITPHLDGEISLRLDVTHG